MKALRFWADRNINRRKHGVFLLGQQLKVRSPWFIVYPLRSLDSQDQQKVCSFYMFSDSASTQLSSGTAGPRRVAWSGCHMQCVFEQKWLLHLFELLPVAWGDKGQRKQWNIWQPTPSITQLTPLGTRHVAKVMDMVFDRKDCHLLELLAEPTEDMAGLDRGVMCRGVLSALGCRVCAALLISVNSWRKNCYLQFFWGQLFKMSSGQGWLWLKKFMVDQSMLCFNTLCVKRQKAIQWYLPEIENSLQCMCLYGTQSGGLFTPKRMTKSKELFQQEHLCQRMPNHINFWQPHQATKCAFLLQNGWP